MDWRPAVGGLTRASGSAQCGGDYATFGLSVPFVSTDQTKELPVVNSTLNRLSAAKRGIRINLQGADQAAAAGGGSAD
jgi:hypothetical protein